MSQEIIQQEAIPPEELAQHAREHMSPDGLTGLGRSAVEARMSEAVDSRMGYPEELAERPEEIKANLMEARQKLDRLTGGLSYPARRMFNRSVESDKPSSWLKQRIGFDPDVRKTPNYVKALTAKRPDGSYVVDDDAFTNFLEWHNYKLAEKQAELDKDAPGYKEQFRDKFHSAVARGWFPQSAAKHLDRLDSTLLVIDDEFQTTFYDGAYAYKDEDYDIGWHVVGLTTSSKNISGIRTHEFVHVIDGRDEEFADNPNATHKTRKAGLKRMFGNKFGGTVINEAATEHFAQSMEHGDFDVINPVKRKLDPQIYGKYRMLLDTLANKGYHKIDIRDFAAAFFEDEAETEVLGQDSAQKQLELKLTTAFPFTDVVKEISGLGSGKSLDDTEVAKYAAGLSKRVRRYRLLPESAAKLITYTLKPKHSDIIEKKAA